MIDGEIAFRQIEGAVALIVQAVIALRGNRKVDAMLVINGPVHPSIEAVLKEGPGNGGCRLGSQ